MSNVNKAIIAGEVFFSPQSIKGNIGQFYLLTISTEGSYRLFPDEITLFTGQHNVVIPSNIFPSTLQVHDKVYVEGILNATSILESIGVGGDSILANVIHVLPATNRGKVSNGFI